MTDIDPNAHTRLNFDPVDAEPTERAEAWSGEQPAEDYPYSPESAPTVIVKEESGNSTMVVVAILIAAVIIFAGIVTVTMTRPNFLTASAPSSTPTTTTMLQSAPPPPVTVTAPAPPPVTVTAAAPPPQRVPLPVPTPQIPTSDCPQRLVNQAAVDHMLTSAQAVGSWVPQLSSKRPGVADGMTWDCEAIWAEHMRLRSAYNAKLFWSGDWPGTGATTTTGSPSRG